MKRTQVLIAGAGPVGTVAGYFLAQNGIDVIVLEAASECLPDLRASTFHPPTLEMLDQLGIVAEMIDQGLKAPVYQYRDRQTNEVFEFDLSELAGELRFPYRLQCEQYKMTRLLVERINSTTKGSVEFSKRVLSFDQDANGVTAHVEAPYGIETYRADYLIAADGANSIVRKWLNVEFEGFTYPEKFLCLSTEWPIEQHFDSLAYVNYVADPSEWVVLLRVPSVWRVLVPANNDTPDEDLLSSKNKDDVFNRLVGDGAAVETQHRTIYRVHQRVAKSYYNGRVVLVGDAAHLNNPLGGLGMNSGVHDAWNLCEKLVDILGNGADAGELLAKYERQRRTVTRKFVQEQTIRNKQLMENKDPEARRAYNQQMLEVLGNDDLRRTFLLKQSLYTSLEEAAQIA